MSVCTCLVCLHVHTLVTSPEYIPQTHPLSHATAVYGVQALAKARQQQAGIAVAAPLQEDETAPGISMAPAACVRATGAVIVAGG